jgi:hypothetical protein
MIKKIFTFERNLALAVLCAVFAFTFVYSQDTCIFCGYKPGQTAERNLKQHEQRQAAARQAGETEIPKTGKGGQKPGDELSDILNSQGGQKAAEEQEGIEVTDTQKGNKYACDKKQDAKKCDKIPPTDIVDAKSLVPGGGRVQFVDSPKDVGTADIGEMSTQDKSKLSKLKSDLIGKWLTTTKPKITSCKNGPGKCYQPSKPKVVEPGAWETTVKMDFVPKQ